ncbi:uncharacterized protein [Typha angustifolia]|uniref:uncharacterized protein n=1 Tax=Typha angustifolia TaxID=59011 RepID=UPI003C2F9A9D
MLSPNGDHTISVGNSWCVLTSEVFLGQRIHTLAQQWWVTKLLGYDYELVYKKGTENQVTDALSRQLKLADLVMISIPVFPFLSKIRVASVEDPEMRELMKKVKEEPSSYPELEVKDGLLLDQGRVRVPAKPKLQVTLIHPFHDTPLAGHEGTFRTYKRLTQNCVWVGAKKEVMSFV